MSKRVVIVTGGFGALGQAVAEAFEKQGDLVCRIDYAPAPEGASELDFGNVDLSDADTTQTVIRQICKQFGEPSVLVNIAGGFTWETIEGGSLETWTHMFKTNALTAVSMCTATLQSLKKSKNASIINIGAMGALNAAAGMGAYASSKAAIAKLTETLADELREQDVTVNSVMPLTIDTPTNRADMPDADFSSWVLPSDIAKVIVFLASEEARVITGAHIPLIRSPR